MANIVIVGTQWGDEGKGKIVDLLTAEADVVVRYQGGANAGHTVVVGSQQYILHLLPSGMLHAGKKCVIGNGVVIDPGTLIEEIEALKAKGFSVDNNLVISNSAHVIMPYHKILDGAYEESKGGKKIGTTGRGIGPCYSDKMARLGVRMSDLAEPERLKSRLAQSLPGVNNLLKNVYGLEELDADAIFEEYSGYGMKLKGYFADTPFVLKQAMDEGKDILLEGAQGTMLDIDHGTFPFVTSSNSTSGGACTGTGLGPTSIDGVIGIVKAYTTRVGAGPFPTELTDATGDHIQQKGREFGATTGRKRRCGWFDAVVVRYAAMINGLTGLCLTKLDVMDELQTIQICNGYRYKGEILKDMPSEPDVFAGCEPIYEEMPGWQSSTVGISSMSDLPAAAQDYIKRLEDVIGVEFIMVSTGPERDETIIKSNPFSWRREVI